MVESLLYAATATRPDICQGVVVVSKFNSCPTEAHLTATQEAVWLKRLLSDIKITPTTPTIIKETIAEIQFLMLEPKHIDIKFHY